MKNKYESKHLNLISIPIDALHKFQDERRFFLVVTKSHGKRSVQVLGDLHKCIRTFFKKKRVFTFWNINDGYTKTSFNEDDIVEVNMVAFK